MRKELLRICALLLALMLVLGTAGGCGKKKQTSGDETEVTVEELAEEEEFEEGPVDEAEDETVEEPEETTEEEETEETEETEATGEEKATTTSTATTTKGTTTTTKTTTTAGTGGKTTTTTAKTSTTGTGEKVDLKGYTVKIASFINLDPKVPTNVYYQQGTQREKEVREKYNVKFQYIMVPGQGIRDRLPASVMAGDPLGDIVRCRSGWVLPVFAGRGIVEPADKYFDISDPLWNPYILQQSIYKGRVMGVNHQENTSYWRLFYNRSMMQRLGLPDPQTYVSSKQWTWQKFEEYLARITQDTDNDGKTDIYGASSLSWQAIIASNGGKIVSEIDGKDYWTLNRPESVEALKWWQKLYNAGYIGYTGESAVADFIAGKAGFYVYYNTNFRTSMKDKWGLVPFPLGPQAKDYANWWDEVHLMCIPANSKYPKEVAAIWTDLSRWYPNAPSREKMHRDVVENMFDDPRDAEMDIMLAKKFWLDKYFSYTDVNRQIWPGGTDNIENVLEGRAGKSIEQWINERSAQCQNIIDQLWASFEK